MQSAQTKKIVSKFLMLGWNLKNIASHFSLVLRMKQKQNHLSLFTTMRKIQWYEREKVFPCFHPGEEEKYHKFAAFFNLEEFYGSGISSEESTSMLRKEEKIQP